MRKSVAIVIGATAVAVATAGGVAAAAAPGAGRADRFSAVVATTAGSATAGSTDPGATNSGSTSPGATNSGSITVARIDAQRARELAAEAVPDGTVVAIEPDDLHDRPVWKVTLATPDGRVVVSVDAGNGQVLTQPPTAPGERPVPLPRVSDDNPGHDRGDDHPANRGPGAERPDADRGPDGTDGHGPGGPGGDDAPGHH